MATRTILLKRPADFDEWRSAVRGPLGAGMEPSNVVFRQAGATADLFAEESESGAATTSRARVPREFLSLARQVMCHRANDRHALLYRLIWRLQSEPRLLQNVADADVWAARRLAKEVRRDVHKMHAFVRFRRVAADGNDAYVAWFEPTHYVVELAAPFFKRRFAGMIWSIVTPDCSAHWDGANLHFDAGGSRRDCPNDDALESYWRVYYSSIFNPARLKLKAMQSEMPVKYWRNLPESRLIAELSRSARRTREAAPTGLRPSVETARRLVAAQWERLAIGAADSDGCDGYWPSDDSQHHTQRHEQQEATEDDAKLPRR